ncbi:MAG: hypothetical protein IJY27_03000 [Clostridia bacterium]|nr:hypothetical protein [Clostridia bacterium]
MFGKKKFEIIVNKTMENFFERAKEKGFFNPWFSKIFDFEEDDKIYSWERALELSKIVSVVKQQSIDISTKLDEMYETNIVCWDDKNKINKFNSETPLAEREERINNDVISILPIMSKLYEINAVVDEINDYWRRCIDVQIMLGAYKLNSEPENVQKESLKKVFHIYDTYVDYIFEEVITSKLPQYNNDKFHNLFDTITYSSENKRKWIQVFEECLFDEIYSLTKKIQLIEFLDTTHPNIDRYFGTCHDFPYHGSCLWLPKRAQTKEFCLKLLEEYKSGKIKGRLYSHDRDRILESIQ